MATDKYINIKVRTGTSKSSVSSLDNKMKGLGRSTDKTTASVSNLSSAFIAVSTALGTSAILRYSDALQKADNELKSITSSAEEFNSVQKALNEIARETRQDVNELTSVYARFKRAGEDAGFTQEDILGLTERLTKAFKIEGNTTAEVNSVMLQLTQSFRSGVIAGEEYKAVSEGSTLVLKALASQLGVTTGELKKMSAEGLVTPEDLIKGLRGFDAEIEKGFTTLQPTFAEVGTAAGNAFSVAFRESGISGVLNDFKSSLIGGLDAVAESFTPEMQLLTKQYTLIEKLGVDAVTSIKTKSEELAQLRSDAAKLGGSDEDLKKLEDSNKRIKEITLEIASEASKAGFLDREFFAVGDLIKEYALLIFKKKEAALTEPLKIKVSGTDETKPKAEPKTSAYASQLALETQQLQNELEHRRLIAGGYLTQEQSDLILSYESKSAAAQARFDAEIAKLGENDAAKKELKLQFDENEKIQEQLLQEALYDIVKDGTDKRISEAEREAREKAAFMSSLQGASIQLGAALLKNQISSNAKSEKEKKKARKKSVVIDTAAGIARAYAENNFYVASGMAAFLVANGISQIAAINSASSVATSTTSSSSQTATTATPTATATETATQKKVVEIRTDGSALYLAAAEIARDIATDENTIVIITEAQAEAKRVGGS